MNRREGTVALVTGGASGIGAAIARRLLSEGARVVVADARAGTDPGGCATLGPLRVRADVSRLEDNHAAVAATIERFGAPDVVVLNAGIGGEGNLVESFDVDRYRRLREINLDGVVYGVHTSRAPMATRGGGTILVTASLAGVFGSPVDPLYAATKSAVIGLVRSLAPVLADDGIAINALCPALVDTPLLGEALPHLVSAGLAVLDADAVADVVDVILDDGRTGLVWPVLPHDPPVPVEPPPVPDLTAVPTDEHDEVPR